MKVRFQVQGNQRFFSFLAELVFAASRLCGGSRKNLWDQGISEHNWANISDILP